MYSFSSCCLIGALTSTALLFSLLFMLCTEHEYIMYKDCNTLFVTLAYGTVSINLLSISELVETFIFCSKVFEIGATVSQQHSDRVLRRHFRRHVRRLV